MREPLTEFQPHPFSIRQIATNRTSFANYEYEILENDTVIARYWHDYRGDDNGITFLDNKKRSWPFTTMSDVVIGGGSQPVDLSANVIEWLRDNMDGC